MELYPLFYQWQTKRRSIFGRSGASRARSRTKLPSCDGYGIWREWQLLADRAVSDTVQSRCKEKQIVDTKTQAKFDARAKIVKAMVHLTRLFIVDELSRCHERCVCELTEMIGAEISTVSKHLSLLKAAGIVADEKRGNMV